MPADQPTFDFNRYAATGPRRDRAAVPREPLGKLFDRNPPFAPEAEMSLLGSMILDPRVIGDVIQAVRGPEAFYDERHGAIFSACVQLFDKHHTGDLVQLSQALTDKGVLEQIGGTDYLVRLAEAVPTAVNAPHFARIVAEKYKLRRLIDAAGQILYETYHVGENTTEASAVIDAAEQKIFEIAEEESSGDPQGLHALLMLEYERLMALEAGEAPPEGVRCGFYDLDEMLGGFQPGEMIIIAARPSMGKCLAADAQILQPDGSLATIEQIVRCRSGHTPTLGDDLTLAFTRPSAFVDDGLKPLFEVTTRLGRRVRTTLTHPFLTIHGWKPLAKLQPGNHLAVPRALPFFGAQRWRECEVVLLAYLLGDGGLTGNAPRFTNRDPRIAEEFAAQVAAFGPVGVALSETRAHAPPSRRVRRNPPDRSGFAARLRHALRQRRTTARALARAIHVFPSSLSHWTHARTTPAPHVFARLCATLDVLPEDLVPEGLDTIRHNDPNPLTAWLQRLGLMGADSHAKFIPPAVFTLERAQLALFLNRLFATDGWATVLASGQPQIGYATVSERLARDLQHLLLRFGIIAKLRRRYVRYKATRRPAWQLDITDAEAMLTFANQIGIFGKETALEAVRAALKLRRRQTNTDLIPLAAWDLVDRARGGRSWSEVARAIGASANLHVRRRAISRPRMARLAAALNDPALHHLAHSDLYWDQIVSIKPLGTHQVYDLTIPGTHNFVADDICVHNTAFALNLAEQMAMGTSEPASTRPERTAQAIGVFSLEMSKQALVQRLLSSWSGYASTKIRRGMLSTHDYEQLLTACGQLGQAPIFIDDTPGLSILQLRARARRMVHKEGVKAIIVDYLQLLSSPASARESRQVEVSSISRGVKALARELKVPVIILSQLNRGPENRDQNKPRLSDLRESGSLEQDADVVMLLHREEYYHIGDHAWLDDPMNSDKVGVAEIIIAKQRNGPTGTVKLTWDANTTRFKNHADARPPADADRFKPEPSPAAATKPAAPSPITTKRPTPHTTTAAPTTPAPASTPRPNGFTPSRPTGPVPHFRDGGGPDRDEQPRPINNHQDEDDLDLPPPPLPDDDSAPF